MCVVGREGEKGKKVGWINPHSLQDWWHLFCFVSRVVCRGLSCVFWPVALDGERSESNEGPETDEITDATSVPNALSSGEILPYNHISMALLTLGLGGLRLATNRSLG